MSVFELLSLHKMSNIRQSVSSNATCPDFLNSIFLDQSVLILFVVKTLLQDIFSRLEGSYCAPKNFGAHFKTLVRECKKIGAQSA